MLQCFMFWKFRKSILVCGRVANACITAFRETPCAPMNVLVSCPAVVVHEPQARLPRFRIVQGEDLFE